MKIIIALSDLKMGKRKTACGIEGISFSFDSSDTLQYRKYCYKKAV